MEQVKVFYDRAGNTLTVWFGDPGDEYTCEEADDEVILRKDRTGRVIGFEKLNFSLPTSEKLRIAFETTSADVGNEVMKSEQTAKQLDDLTLSPNQRQALAEVRRRLLSDPDIEVEEIVLYGSVARGEADEDSDLDLLVVTARPLSWTERHEKITDVVFEVNLRFDTNLSTLVVDREAWEAGLISVLLIREEILRDGVPL